jgi:probable selenium-dependent hydroxylase accessory protein YqeC
MYKLASEFAEKQKKVLVTTSTMIFHPSVKTRPYNNLYIGDVKIFLEKSTPEQGTITIAARKIIIEGKKLKGFSPEDLDLIQKSQIFDIILVEADGARGKPIKAPAKFEPVIPIETDIYAAIIGMDCLGTEINEENVHRSDIFSEITNSSLGDIIDTHLVHNLLISPDGAFKNTSPECRNIVIFNKSDTAERIKSAKKISDSILESSGIDRILITSMTGNDPVMAVINLKTGAE